METKEIEMITVLNSQIKKEYTERGYRCYSSGIIITQEPKESYRDILDIHDKKMK